jgi:hypothetical protein
MSLEMRGADPSRKLPGPAFKRWPSVLSPEHRHEQHREHGLPVSVVDQLAAAAIVVVG